MFFLFVFDLYFLIASGVIQLRKAPRALSLQWIHFSKNNNHWRLCEKRGHCTICLYQIRSNNHYQNKELWLLVCRSCALFLLPFCSVFDFEQSLSHIYTHTNLCFILEQKTQSHKTYLQVTVFLGTGSLTYQDDVRMWDTSQRWLKK